MRQVGFNFEQEQTERTEKRLGHKYGNGNGELEPMPIECPALRSIFPSQDFYISDHMFLTESTGAKEENGDISYDQCSVRATEGRVFGFHQA